MQCNCMIVGNRRGCSYINCPMKGRMMVAQELPCRVPYTYVMVDPNYENDISINIERITQHTVEFVNNYCDTMLASRCTATLLKASKDHHVLEDKVGY